MFIGYRSVLPMIGVIDSLHSWRYVLVQWKTQFKKIYVDQLSIMKTLSQCYLRWEMGDYQTWSSQINWMANTDFKRKKGSTSNDRYESEGPEKIWFKIVVIFLLLCKNSDKKFSRSSCPILYCMSLGNHNDSYRVLWRDQLCLRFIHDWCY